MSQLDIQSYLDTPRHLAEAVEGLDRPRLAWKAAPQSWSVTEVLTHLLDHNLVVSFRIRDLLAETTVQLPAFNQDNWVNGQKANEGAAADVLQGFEALIRYNGLLLRRLSPEDLDKSGISHRGQPVTVAEIIAGFVKHVHHHIGQIERIKQSQAAAERA